MWRFSDPELLIKGHELDGFDCGKPSLTQWLLHHARSAQGSGSARVYVVTDSQQADRVVGYYGLSPATISHEDATDEVRKHMPRYPIPGVLLARLAVDGSVQGRGLGAFLLKDAMTRGLAGAEVVGGRVFLVHALDEGAREFYLRFGFEPSPTDALNLQVLIKDIKKTLDPSV